MEENKKPLSREEIEISNIVGVDSTIYGKDKIINLNTLIHKINSDYKFIQANFEDSLTINYLKYQCFLLEEFILDAQEYADVTNVTEKRKKALIGNIKGAREIQERFENVLIELGTFRDIDNENELFAAFDFNLDSDNSGNIINSKPNLVHGNKCKDKAKTFPTNYKEEAALKIAQKDLTAYLTRDENGIKYGSSSEICKELGLDSSKHGKYITGTLNQYKPDATSGNGSKNIFNDSKLLPKVVKHCDDNNIQITPYFQKKLDLSNSKL